MTPKQILVFHIHAEHRRRPPAAARSRSDLQRWHANEHFRYAWSLTHFHEYDGTERPSGWYTGLKSIPKSIELKRKKA